MIGLGRMGANMVRRLLAAGHDCAVHDVNEAAIAALGDQGATGASTLAQLAAALARQIVLWLFLE
jgi:6-phosphogluconate dehydrogenase